MNDLVIAIPVGVSSPGTPVIPYLKACLNSLKNQKTSYKYKVVIASDNNVSTEAMDCMLESGFDMQLYEPYYFMRRGGIWKKIYDQWSNFETKYVAFCHYDDMWSENKIQSQLDLMEQNSLELSWSRVQAINDKSQIISDDLAGYQNLNKDSLKNGGSYAFSHSSIIKKQSLFDTGILNKIEKAAAIYEGLQFVYSHKLKGTKDNNCTFYHRVHGDSVSNQFHTETEFMKEQRIIADYSVQQVMKDADEVYIDEIKNEIEKYLT